MAATKIGATKAPTTYKTIAAACSGRALGKLRGVRARVECDSYGIRRFRLYDGAGTVRLDLPLISAFEELCKARGFRDLGLEAL